MKKTISASSRHRFSLFAKFALVIMLLGIVPIILLTTVMQGRLINAYRRSLERTYREALTYAAYSIEARLDTFNDLSKSCYSYGFSSDNTSAFNLGNFDTLRQILTGQAFPDFPNLKERIRQEMELFLHRLNITDSDIEASHFVYAPDDAAPVVYHRRSVDNSVFSDDIFLEEVQYDTLDRDSRSLILVGTHPAGYIQYPSLADNYVFTIARNYYDLTKPVGQEEYIGTLYIDISLRMFQNSIRALSLTEAGTFYLCDTAGSCWYSSDPGSVDQVTSRDFSRDGAFLSQDVDGYDLTIWYDPNGYPIESQIRTLQSAMYLVVLISVVALSLGSILFSRRLTRPIRMITQRMGEIEAGNFQGQIPIISNDELGDLTARFNQMSAQLDAYTKQVYLSKIRQTEAELNALRSQIYPHFLYNTLEVIRMTAINRQDEMVAGMIESLSDQIRYVVGTINDLVPLRLEIDILQKYVYLLNCRFDNKVSFVFDCQQLEDHLIPKLILQPLVENAFNHGIKPMQGKGYIRLTAEQTQDDIVLTVMDNGVGMTQQAMDRLRTLLDSDKPGERQEYTWGSIGLKNVHDRLRYMYGAKYGITIFSTPGVGTAVKVMIPGTLVQSTSKRGCKL